MPKTSAARRTRKVEKRRKAPTGVVPGLLAPEVLPLDDLVSDPRNARRHDERNLRSIEGSLRRFGQHRAFVGHRTADGKVLVRIGNGMLEAMRRLGWKEAAVVVVEESETDAVARAIADNRAGELAVWDDEVLAALLRDLPEDVLPATGFDATDLDAMLRSLEAETTSGTPAAPADGSAQRKDAAGRLARTFGVPPFSVLDARQGYWIERKRAWEALGLGAATGRRAGLLFPLSDTKSEAHRKIVAAAPSTSVFDPVLAELAVRWFSPQGGTVLDPFAGGPARGVVAAVRGRRYVGIDVRPEQVAANREAWKAIAGAFPGSPPPEWREGDSRDLPAPFPAAARKDFADLVFSCPPYFDLERYAPDDERDLANLSWRDFGEAYRAVIRGACALLADGRFAVFVVGDVRDPKTGVYRDLPGLTISAFEACGLRLWNSLVYLQQSASGSMRAARLFRSGRKVVRLHQVALVFVKGDAAAANKACGAIGDEDFGEVPAIDAAAADVEPFADAVEEARA